MVASTIQEREAVIRQGETEVRRWSGYVETLLHAFRRNDDAPPSLGSKMEELRNKRDSVVTKVEALKRHKQRGWSEARGELEVARRELKESWRTVIGTLDRESLFT